MRQKFYKLLYNTMYEKQYYEEYYYNSVKIDRLINGYAIVLSTGALTIAWGK